MITDPTPLAGATELDDDEPGRTLAAFSVLRASLREKLISFDEYLNAWEALLGQDAPQYTGEGGDPRWGAGQADATVFTSGHRTGPD